MKFFTRALCAGLSLSTLLLGGCESQPGSGESGESASALATSQIFLPDFRHYTSFYTAADGIIWARDNGAGSWRHWYDFSSRGRYKVSNPGAVSWGGGRMDVFDIDSSTNTMLHSYAANVSSFVYYDNWDAPAGYTFFGKPDAASWGDQRVDVFAAARDAAGKTVVMHRGWDHGHFYGWESWGALGTLVGGVTATSWGPGRIDVFALTTDPSQIFHAHVENGGPVGSDWWVAPVALLNEPNTLDVASWGPGRLDLFALDRAGAIRHEWYSQTVGDMGVRTAWDFWGNPSASPLASISVAAPLLNDLIVSVQDQTGPSIYDYAWISGPTSWSSPSYAPGGSYGYLSGGFDIARW